MSSTHSLNNKVQSFPPCLCCVCYSYFIRSNCLSKLARSRWRPSVSLYISLEKYKNKNWNIDIQQSVFICKYIFTAAPCVYKKRTNAGAPAVTHISFSSCSREDWSCSRASCSWARVSSWLVCSSSWTSASFVCFSFTFSTLVTCCSLWRSWHWRSSCKHNRRIIEMSNLIPCCHRLVLFL